MTSASKLKKNTIEELRKVGVYLHKGGFGYDSLSSAFISLPLCAIWYESEEPTPDELTELSEIPKALAEYFNPQCVRNYCVEGVNMVTLKKENGKWTYRKMTWSEGPMWYPKYGSLENIKEEILGKRKFN